MITLFNVLKSRMNSGFFIYAVAYIVLVFGLSKSIVVAQENTAFYERSALSKVKDPRLNEVSGLVASRKYPGYFWCHNDSGDKARIFLINKQSEVLAEYSFEGENFVDLEDLAWICYDNKSYLLLADIGDNQAKRPSVQLYLIEEPDYDPGEAMYDVAAADIRKIKVTYKDGPRDAEAIFVDPLDQLVYIITKRDFQSRVYAFDIFPNVDKQHIRLDDYETIPTTFVTAADISADGSLIIVKNLLNIYQWKRNGTEPIFNSLSRSYQSVPYVPEPQGEALAFDVDGYTFYTLSERPLALDSYLYRYKLY